MTEIQGAFFSECDHRHILVVPETRGPHHARKICSDCRKFLGWIPKPETVERQRRNAEILSMLARRTDLGEWERNFVRDLSGNRHLSPKEQAKLLELHERYGKGTPAP